MRSTTLHRTALSAPFRSLNRWLATVTAVALVALAPLARAQEATGTITGRVQNASNGAYLKNVTVKVDGTNLEAVSDEFGNFEIERVPAGSRTLKARYIGVATKAGEAGSFFRPEILALPDEKLQEYLQSPKLVAYKLLLDRLDVRSEPVPLLLGQGPLAIATTLGILKAGKYYVPLDPSWGLPRAVDLVHELDARVLLTDAEFATPLRDRLGAAAVLELRADRPEAPGPPVHVETAPDRPAYVYFTSGSTGRPKGVIDCHRNVLHNVMRYTHALGIGRADRLSLLQSCGFSGAGLPIGLQILGRPLDEARVLRAAYAYEQATAWRTRQPELV